MEVIASNAGLLTNVEVLDIIKENRAKRSALNGAKVEVQGRELVETKTIKYVSGKAIGSVTSDASEKCLKEIKALNLGLTEGELVQIANLAPRSEVEFYLIIEECAHRCDEDQLASISAIVKKYYFPNEMDE